MDCGADVSLTERNSGTTQQLPFRVNKTIELQNIRNTSGNICTLEIA